jgi:hypothetical protein
MVCTSPETIFPSLLLTIRTALVLTLRVVYCNRRGRKKMKLFGLGCSRLQKLSGFQGVIDGQTVGDWFQAG